MFKRSADRRLLVNSFGLAVVCALAFAGASHAQYTFHPGESFSDVAGNHDLNSRPLLGADVFAFTGSNFGIGAVTAMPGNKSALIEFADLQAQLNIDPADYGIVGFRAGTEVSKTGGQRTLSSHLILDHGGGGESIGLGSAKIARYRVVDPTRAAGEFPDRR